MRIKKVCPAQTRGLLWEFVRWVSSSELHCDTQWVRFPSHKQRSAGSQPPRATTGHLLTGSGRKRTFRARASGLL